MAEGRMVSQSIILEKIENAKKAFISFLIQTSDPDVSPLDQKIKRLNFYAAVILGLLVALLLFRTSVSKSISKKKTKVKALLRETERALASNTILNDNVRSILKLNRSCTRWRIVISDNFVIILEGTMIKMNVEYEETPLPLSIVGLLHSAILNPDINFNRPLRPQVVYIIAPEYPNDHFNQISLELRKIKVELIKSRQFDVDKLDVKKNLPCCTVKTIKNFVCNFCKKSLSEPEWCKKCSIIAYCDTKCFNDDKDHHLVCEALSLNNKAIISSSKEFPFVNTKNTDEILEHVDICNYIVYDNLHGSMLFKRVCGCFDSLIPLQLYAEISSRLFITHVKKENDPASLLGLNPHWTIFKPPLHDDILNINSWNKLYNNLRIPKTDIAYLVLYFPLTLWYLVIHIANITANENKSAKNKSNIIRIHVANVEDEVDYLFLVRILVRLISKTEIQFSFFSKSVSTNIWLPHTRAAVLKDVDGSNAVMFSVCPVKYSKNYFYGTIATKHPAICDTVPDIVIALPPQNGNSFIDDVLIDAIKKEGKWLFFLSNDFSMAHMALLKSLGSEKDNFDIVNTRINPFRRSGTITSPSQRDIPSWKLGYFSGFKRKNITSSQILTT